MYGSGPSAAMGPDELGAGKAWRLQGVPGESFRIVLERRLESDIMMTMVHWIKTQEQIARPMPTRYFVIGDWDHWTKPLLMTERNGTHVLDRQMPLDGIENFLILCDGSY